MLDKKHSPSPTMPRTSNLFITSPRAGAHPAGKVSCLGFRGGTRALSGSWGGELWGSGERWPVSPHHPSSALLCFSFPRPCCLPAFCFLCSELPLSFIYGSDSSCFIRLRILFIPYFAVVCMVLLSTQLYLKDQWQKKARCYNMLSEGLSGGPSVLAHTETCYPGTDGG